MLNGAHSSATLNIQVFEHRFVDHTRVGLLTDYACPEYGQNDLENPHHDLAHGGSFAEIADANQSTPSTSAAVSPDNPLQGK